MTDTNNNEHPITPPPELVTQWSWAALDEDWGGGYDREMIATQAAQWGADQELEACCEWARHQIWDSDECLRAERRPKPLSLKEQALAMVEQHEDGWRPSPKDWDTIRRALEQLDD